MLSPDTAALSPRLGLGVLIRATRERLRPAIAYDPLADVVTANGAGAFDRLSRLPEIPRHFAADRTGPQIASQRRSGSHPARPLAGIRSACSIERKRCDTRQDDSAVADFQMGRVDRDRAREQHLPRVPRRLVSLDRRRRQGRARRQAGEGSAGGPAAGKAPRRHVAVRQGGGRRPRISDTICGLWLVPDRDAACPGLPLCAELTGFVLAERRETDKKHDQDDQSRCDQ